jgi:hypothetical protein
MTFTSILYEHHPADEQPLSSEAPAYFRDLNLDQLVADITVAKSEYDLGGFFYTPLKSVDAIGYRHEIMRDLEDPALYQHIVTFAERMRTMRERLRLVNKLYYKYQRERWFLDVVDIYIEAVNGLTRALAAQTLTSRGFRALSDTMARYAQSEAFTQFQAEARQVTEALTAVRYILRIRGNSVRVQKYEPMPDYSAEIEEVFAKFKKGAVKDYRAKLKADLAMNHVEAQVLDRVALLYPDVFARLDDFCVRYQDFADATVITFDREVQFYIAYQDFIAQFKRAGLHLCYPQIATDDKHVHSRDGFDMALASRLIATHAPVVCNDFYLEGSERVLVVSGPNQGGKTTFARMFGQLHHFASLGLPVPGSSARLYLFDALYTHFEVEEDIANLSGKLQDDVKRVHEILTRATSGSIIILNEIFTSTTLKDAMVLGQRVLESILERDALGVCVTFIDEWATLNEKTVSMVSSIVPENPALRTYKIVRRSADGLAYAMAIAEKYRLTSAAIKERIPS